MCAVNTNRAPSVLGGSRVNDLFLPERLVAAISQASEWSLKEIQLPPPSAKNYPKEFIENYSKQAISLKDSSKQIAQLQEVIIGQEEKREKSIIIRAWNYLTENKTLEVDIKVLVDNVNKLDSLFTKRDIAIRGMESLERKFLLDSKQEIVKLEAQQLARKESHRIRDEAFICSLLKLEKGGENFLSQETVALVRNLVLSNEKQRGSEKTQLSATIQTLSFGDNKSQLEVLRYVQNITSSKNYKKFIEHIRTENEFRSDSAYDIIKYDSLTFVLAVAGAVTITAFTGGLGATVATPLISFFIRGAITRAVISFAANYLATSVLMGIGTVGGEQAGKEINNLVLGQLEKFKIIDCDERLLKNGSLIRKYEELGAETIALSYADQVRKNVIVNMGTQVLGLGFGKILGVVVSPAKFVVSRLIFGKTVNSTVAKTAKESLKRQVVYEVVEESTENVVVDGADLVIRDNQLTYIKQGLSRLGLGEYADAGGTILSALKIALTRKGVKSRNNIQNNSNDHLDFLAEQKETLESKLQRIYNDPGRVKFVTQLELQQKLRAATGRISNALLEGLYERGASGSFIIYINESIRSEEKRWEIFNHEVRHRFGELSDLRKSRETVEYVNKNEKIKFKRIVDTLRDVEVRAHYQQLLVSYKSRGIYETLTLDDKKTIYKQIKENVSNNYTDKFLLGLDHQGLAAAIEPKKKKTPEIYVSKKPQFKPDSKEHKGLVSNLKLFAETGEIKYLENARIIRRNFSIPKNLSIIESLSNAASDAKFRIANDENIDAMTFSMLSTLINYLTNNSEEQDREYELPLEFPELEVDKIEIVVQEDPLTQAEKLLEKEDIIDSASQLFQVAQWLTASLKTVINQYRELSAQKQSKNVKDELAIIQNTLSSLTYALGNLAEVEKVIPRSLHLHQLSAIQAFIEQLAEDPQRRRGRFIEPTGAGKTTIYGTISLLFGWKTVILTNRENLQSTIRKELLEGVGLSPDRVSILQKGNIDYTSQVCITTYAGHRAALIRKDQYVAILKDAQLIVCDEGHRSLGKETSGTLHNAYQARNRKTIKMLTRKVSAKAWSIAVTATPNLARKSVSILFPHLIHRSSYRELVEAGVIKRFKVIQTPVTIKPHEVPRGMTTHQEVLLLRQKRVHESLLTAFCETKAKISEPLYALATCLTIAECDRLKLMAERDFGLRCEIVTSREMKGFRGKDKSEKTPLELAEDRLAAGEIDMIISAEKLREGWDYRRLNAVLQVMASQSPARVLQPPGRASRRFEDQQFAYIFEPSWIGLSMVKIGEGEPTKTKKPRGVRPKNNDNGDLLITAPTNNTPLTLVDALELLGEEDVDSVCETLDGKPLRRFRLLPVDSQGEIIIDNTPCVALRPYADLNGLVYSSLTRSLNDAKLIARGHAKLDNGSAVLVYKKSEIEALAYVLANKDKPEIRLDEKGFVTTVNGILAVAISRFIQEHKMDFETLEKHIRAANIEPIGKALAPIGNVGGERVVVIYSYAEIMKIPYVKKAIKYKDNILNKYGRITIDETVCMGLHGFLDKFKLDNRIFIKAVEDAKIKPKGKAKTGGGQIVDVYALSDLRNIEYAKQSLKLRKLPAVDSKTGEVVVRSVTCIAVRRFASLHGLSHVLLLDAIKEAKIRSKGDARVPPNRKVAVYPKEKVLRLKYCQRLTLPKITKDNKTGIIHLDGRDYIAVFRYAKHISLEGDDLTKAVEGAELTSTRSANANGQIVALYLKDEVDQLEYVRGK